MSTKRIGDAGEQRALRHLRKKGLRLLEKNYRYGRYEIDLVMEDRDFLVFVEVKARSETNFGTPAMAVGKEKQRFLIAAAQGYLQQNRCENRFVRFDVVEVYLSEDRIVHIENAFCG